MVVLLVVVVSSVVTEVMEAALAVAEVVGGRTVLGEEVVVAAWSSSIPGACCRRRVRRAQHNSPSHSLQAKRCHRRTHPSRSVLQCILLRQSVECLHRTEGHQANLGSHDSPQEPATDAHTRRRPAARS